MVPPLWLWIPLTIWAAIAQTARNAAQRHLTAELGTIGATLVRFLYGLPFTAVYLGFVLLATGESAPALTLPFVNWVAGGALAQVAATALLLRVMAERNFALGVAYSKTELVQVAVFGALFLGDPISGGTALAIALATTGVLMLSPVDRERPLVGFVTGWTSRAALEGVLSGGCFALASVGYRGAALALPDTPYPVSAAYSVVWGQAMQSVVMVGWLLARDAPVLARIALAWRPSMVAGATGAAASLGSVTAMAVEPVAHVRTLFLVELLFSYLVSRRLFRERLSRNEVLGVVLLTVGLAVITLGR